MFMYMESTGPIITKPTHNPKLMEGIMGHQDYVWTPESCRSDTSKHWGLSRSGSSMALGVQRHMLLQHQAVSHLGAPLAKTVIKAHGWETGDDCMGGLNMQLWLLTKYNI